MLAVVLVKGVQVVPLSVEASQRITPPVWPVKLICPLLLPAHTDVAPLADVVPPMLIGALMIFTCDVVLTHGAEACIVQTKV